MTVSAAFYSYPPNSLEHVKAMSHITELRQLLIASCGVDLRLQLLNGHEAFPSYAKAMSRFIDACVSSAGHVRVRWLHVLAPFAGSEVPLGAVRAVLVDDWKIDESDFSVAERWVEQCLTALPKPIVRQFVRMPRELWQLGDGGPWGSELFDDAVIPDWSTAAERTGYCESIFHAFLHLLGVGEGYDAEFEPIESCSADCWMQYDPTQRGTRLCDTHVAELSFYLENREHN